jgi:hypothetical protein
MILANGLPNTRRAAFDPAITNNRFALWIGAPKKGQEKVTHRKFVESEALTLLKQIGASEARTVYEKGWF